MGVFIAEAWSMRAEADNVSDAALEHGLLAEMAEAGDPRVMTTLIVSARRPGSAKTANRRLHPDPRRPRRTGLG